MTPLFRRAGTRAIKTGRRQSMYTRPHGNRRCFPVCNFTVCATVCVRDCSSLGDLFRVVECFKRMVRQVACSHAAQSFPAAQSAGTYEFHVRDGYTQIAVITVRLAHSFFLFGQGGLAAHASHFQRNRRRPLGTIVRIIRITKCLPVFSVVPPAPNREGTHHRHHQQCRTQHGHRPPLGHQPSHRHVRVVSVGRIVAMVAIVSLSKK
jgi:hypothetical protein